MRTNDPLVLSLFPGADLLGMAFELEGFCVVQGPDVQWGRDIKDFHPPAGRFDGVIGGPPCQRFSQLKRTGELAENLIPEFERVVGEARPDWFLMENVTQAPTPWVHGYEVRTEVLNNRWLGEEQSRKRAFTFGFQRTDERRTDQGYFLPGSFELASCQVALENPIKEGCFTANATQWQPGVDIGRKKGRSRSSRTIGEFRKGCRLQGLPDTFLDDSPFTVEGKIRLVGNGVPIPMGRAVARAVKRALGIDGTGVTPRDSRIAHKAAS